MTVFELAHLHELGIVRSGLETIKCIDNYMYDFECKVFWFEH